MYRVLHPYAAPSERAFSGWNLAKQASSEVSFNHGKMRRGFFHLFVLFQWLRAKTVSRVLKTVKSFDPTATSAKEVARLLKQHGYSYCHLSKFIPKKALAKAFFF